MSRERLEEKLGWLRDFADGLTRWQACQTVICATLRFLINQHGLFEGVVAAYHTLTADLGVCPASQQLVADMTVPHRPQNAISAEATVFHRDQLRRAMLRVSSLTSGNSHAT